MQITFVSYFLASIIAYLGLLLGIILIKLSPEEQKPGKKYFIILKKILFIIILISLLFFYKLNIIFITVLILFSLILILNKKLNLEKAALVYLLLWIVFYLSSKILNLFILESVLIFLYGIPVSSLILKKKNYIEIFVKNLWFFVPVVLLYFII